MSSYMFIRREQVEELVRDHFETRPTGSKGKLQKHLGNDQSEGGHSDSFICVTDKRMKEQQDPLRVSCRTLLMHWKRTRVPCSTVLSFTNLTPKGWMMPLYWYRTAGWGCIWPPNLTSTDKTATDRIAHHWQWRSGIKWYTEMLPYHSIFESRDECRSLSESIRCINEPSVNSLSRPHSPARMFYVRFQIVIVCNVCFIA